jgi:hypothetical protein
LVATQILIDFCAQIFQEKILLILALLQTTILWVTYMKMKKKFQEKVMEVNVKENCKNHNLKLTRLATMTHIII